MNESTVHTIKGSSHNDKLAFVLENISKAVIMVNAAGFIEYANATFCKVFNLIDSPEALTGKPFQEVLDLMMQLVYLPKDFLSLIEKYQQEKKPVKRFNVHLINHNVFEIDYIPVFSTSQFQGHLWLFKDITDLKQLQDQTQQQQDFYEKVLNNLPADISIFDSNHKYLFANKQAVSKDDMREWLIGKDDFDYSLSLNEGFEKAISRRNYFEQSVQTNQTIQFEEKIVNTDGKEIYNLRHFYPYINPQKQVEFVVGYGVNISKIRQNEKLLVRSVETYQKLLNDLDEVVFIIDGNNQLQYVNPLWERVWGKSYYESVGNPITNFFNKENTQLLNEDINALRLENGSDKIKRIIKVDLPNGETKHFQYYLRRFYSLYKEELRVSGFMVDITDQIKVQEELLNILEKERQLSDMKTVFVNMVSHELRTPLSIIQSSAEILELLYQDKATNETELQAYTHRIVEEVKNLKDLMDELLLVSRIEANKINFNPDEIDITAFVNDLTNQQYRPWRDGRNLLLETRGNGKLVKADKFMMRHLLNNIIDNAFKYSPNKAEPIVRIFFGQENWSIVCRDHGIGIPSKDINDLGTSFKRGANVGSIQGTGLGLVVVRYFVEKHNGTIEYQSEEGQGTIVRIHFPY